MRRIALLLGFVSLLSLCTWRAAQAQSQSILHTVQPGENLFRIGLKYGVGWQAIMQANGLTSTLIYPGQQLIIPLDAPGAPASPTSSPGAVSAASATEPPPPDQTPTPAAPTPPLATPLTYIVQPGDTLFKIATRYGTTVADIVVVNQLINPERIYPGQTLTLPIGSNSPLPAAYTGNQQIIIDLSEQHLYAYAGETLVYSFVASTGAPGMATRPGTYSVLTKLPNAYGSNWDIWMPNWLGIYWVGRLQNGIHALPILSDGSRLWSGYLGTPVSYGCIILGIAEAQQLYDWAEIGTPVTIRY